MSYFDGYLTPAISNHSQTSVLQMLFLSANHAPESILYLPITSVYNSFLSLEITILFIYLFILLKAIFSHFPCQIQFPLSLLLPSPPLDITVLDLRSTFSFLIEENVQCLSFRPDMSLNTISLSFICAAVDDRILFFFYGEEDPISFTNESTCRALGCCDMLASVTSAALTCECRYFSDILGFFALDMHQEWGCQITWQLYF